MSSILNEAAKVVAPVVGRVIRLDVSTTAARFAIPASWAGQQCTWTLYSDNLTDVISCDVLFGDSAVAVTNGTQSTVVAEAITITTTTIGATLVSGGESRHWIMPTSAIATHFGVDASANGTLEIVRG